MRIIFLQAAMGLAYLLLLWAKVIVFYALPILTFVFTVRAVKKFKKEHDRMPNLLEGLEKILGGFLLSLVLVILIIAILVALFFLMNPQIE